MTTDFLASIAEGMIVLPFTDIGTYVGRSGLRLDVESKKESQLEIWMLSFWYEEDRQVEISSGSLKGEVQVMHANLGVVSGIIRFKSIRLDEIRKRACRFIIQSK